MLGKRILRGLRGAFGSSSRSDIPGMPAGPAQTETETMQYHTASISIESKNHHDKHRIQVDKLEIGIKVKLDSSKQPIPISLCVYDGGGRKLQSPVWEARKPVGRVFGKKGEGAAEISVAFKIAERAGTKVSTSSLLNLLIVHGNTDLDLLQYIILTLAANPYSEKRVILDEFSLQPTERHLSLVRINDNDCKAKDMSLGVEAHPYPSNAQGTSDLQYMIKIKRKGS